MLDVNWSEVIRPTSLSRFRAHKSMNSNVASLRLFPGITETTIRTFLAPPIQGVVLETYGAGNAPSTRADLIAALKEACDRGVVIVNCTQCTWSYGFSSFFGTICPTLVALVLRFSFLVPLIPFLGHKFRQAWIGDRCIPDGQGPL